MSRAAFRFIITGRVQGVFFRDYTRETARRLGLEGWVRNLPDGSVEARARGAGTKLAELEAALVTGSPASRVAGVAREALDPSDEDLPSGTFEVRY